MQFNDLTVSAEANGIARIDAHELWLRAGPRTDWFVHPAGESSRSNVIRCSVATRERVFTLSAKVSVAFSDTYDAGALFVQVDEDNWAKLAFELSGAGKPTVVSVITRGTSDDADGPVVEGDTVWLRMHCDGQTLACHFSVDGQHWQFLRWFTLPGIDARPLRIGFGAQAPIGEGCSVHFSELGWSLKPIENLRDGS